MSTLQEGSAAPAINVLTDTGAPFQLTDLKGKKVVLYFYPKADTPGCTKESCEFRDAIEDFHGLDAEVVGISPDTPDAQAKFRKKFDLPFTLLADADHKVCEDFGVWVEKSMYGKQYMGVERSTFLIDAAGTIKKIYRKVKPEGHAEEVKAAIPGV